MKHIFSIIIFAFFITTILLLSCYPNSKKQNSKKGIYNTDNVNELPDTIRVVGKILEFRNGYCGTICSGGIIKVKLNSSYLNILDTLHIITACANVVTERLNIDVIATRLLATDSACYYLYHNKLDTLEHQYYKLSEAESGKL